jgi:hypothetical protein
MSYGMVCKHDGKGIQEKDRLEFVNCRKKLPVEITMDVMLVSSKC